MPWTEQTDAYADLSCRYLYMTDDNVFGGVFQIF